MLRIVIVQFCATCIVGALGLLISGPAAGISALAGGLCCAIPNALFALRLYRGTLRPGGATPSTFFTGEFVKILATIALMGAVVKWYHALHWLAFVAAFAVVLKSYMILLLRNA